jgi:hypothetical protein
VALRLAEFRASGVAVRHAEFWHHGFRLGLRWLRRFRLGLAGRERLRAPQGFAVSLERGVGTYARAGRLTACLIVH